VLVELGAICPAVGLYLIDKSFAEDPRLDAWIARAKPLLPK
jgi:FMN reductase